MGETPQAYEPDDTQLVEYRHAINTGERGEVSVTSWVFKPGVKTIKVTAESKDAAVEQIDATITGLTELRAFVMRALG